MNFRLRKKFQLLHKITSIDFSVLYHFAGKTLYLKNTYLKTIKHTKPAHHNSNEYRAVIPAQLYGVNLTDG